MTHQCRKMYNVVAAQVAIQQLCRASVSLLFTISLDIISKHIIASQ